MQFPSNKMVVLTTRTPQRWPISFSTH